MEVGGGRSVEVGRGGIMVTGAGKIWGANITEVVERARAKPGTEVYTIVNP